MSYSFRELNIWKKGFGLLMQIYKVSSKFPKQETYGLIDQLRRSANSVIANIAEAQGRFHFADRCRVLYQARGECFETQSHILVAKELGYLGENEAKEIDVEYEGLSKGISVYVSSMKALNSKS